jgi:hypothetical protein
MAGRRRGDRPRPAGILVLAALGASVALASCAPAHAPFLVGSPTDRADLEELFTILDDEGSDEIERFAAVRQISSILLAQRQYGRLAVLLTGIAAESEGETSLSGEGLGAQEGVAGGKGLEAGTPFVAWYLFTAAYAYELQGAAPMAALYYDRIVKNWPDLIVEGRSIHYECLSRLIETVDSPERRIEYYKDIIARFPERADMGRVLFLLAKEYERVGDWDLAIKTYSRYLPYFGVAIPGHPEAFQYARNIVDFYNSTKDWAYDDLQVLVTNIKTALSAGDPNRLRRYKAKVNFFAISWHQDETEVNSPVLFDFAEFMSGGRIYSAESLDPSSGSREAFLKTWGWSERITTWYLYFRKIYFPADPEIHGRWEWAGIYFGERMQ